MSLENLLNQKFKPNPTDDGTGTSKAKKFELIPEGFYEVKLLEIKPWTLRKARVTPFVYTANGDRELDEDGSFKRLPEGTYEFVSTIAKVQITKGDHKGRVIFQEISTYPNTPWVIPSFIGCFDGTQKPYALTELNDLVGREGLIVIASKTRDKLVKKVDDYGIETEETETVTSNHVKRWLRKRVAKETAEDVFSLDVDDEPVLDITSDDLPF